MKNRKKFVQSKRMNITLIQNRNKKKNPKKYGKLCMN